MSGAVAVARKTLRVEARPAQPESEASVYLRAHPESTPFQSDAWMHAVRDAYGHRAYDLVARDAKGWPRGAVRLHLLESPFLPTTLASSPFGSVGGICADDDEARIALAERAIQLREELGAARLELKNAVSVPADALVGHQDFADYRLTMQPPDTLWEDVFPNEPRRAVRRARENGLVVRRGPHLLDAFLEVMSRSMRRLGTPDHSRRFYAAILERFGRDAELMVVEHEKRPISVHLLLHSPDTVWSVYQGSLRETWSLYPNYLLYWEGLELAWSRGARRFDFGRSLVDSGHARFKSAFGARPTPLFYQYHVRGDGEAPRIHAGNRAYRIARTVWQRLPLALTRAVGPSLIRGVP